MADLGIALRILGKSRFELSILFQQLMVVMLRRSSALAQIQGAYIQCVLLFFRFKEKPQKPLEGFKSLLKMA